MLQHGAANTKRKGYFRHILPEQVRRRERAASLERVRDIEMEAFHEWRQSPQF
jgi:hypothetical protein